MLRSTFLYLIFFIMILGEKKLFYNSEGVILYNITSSKVEVIKKKKLEINNEVNLKEILLKKDFRPINGIDIKYTIKYVEYDENENTYHVYFELSFFDGKVLITKTEDKTLVMGVYDGNFNYIDMKEYPTYDSIGEVNVVEKIINYKNGAILFFKMNNNDYLTSLKYKYKEKEVYLIQYKNGIETLNEENIKKIFQPQIMSQKHSFILGTYGLNGTIKENKLYKYNLKKEKVEIIKEFSDIAVFLMTLIENDEKLIYSTLNLYDDTKEYGNKGRKIFVLDLKSLKEKEFILRNDLFEEFYYSHEVRNTNNELIEKFYKSK